MSLNLKIAESEPRAPIALSCGGCASCGVGVFRRSGRLSAKADATVAVMGNPNVGKSTVFNGLTGLRQHVGNWPGKTVMRAEGAFRLGERLYRLIDLPGTYSLMSQSPDEEAARDYLLFGQPDVTVVVCDAGALERNLNLVLQVREVAGAMVLALNLMDEAERKGIRVDERALARDLGVPVVPMAARSGKGLAELANAIDGLSTGRLVCRPAVSARLDPEIEAAVVEIELALKAEFPDLPHVRWIALRLLEGDADLEREVTQGTLGRLGHPPEAAL